MNEPRTFIIDAAPVYSALLDIASKTVPEFLTFQNDPGLLDPVVRTVIGAVLIRKTVNLLLPHASHQCDMVTLNIRSQLKKNRLGIRNAGYLLFLERLSTDPRLLNRTAKLFPFTPLEYRPEIHCLYKTIWCVRTGFQL